MARTGAGVNIMTIEEGKTAPEGGTDGVRVRDVSGVRHET